MMLATSITRIKLITFYYYHIGNLNDISVLIILAIWIMLAIFVIFKIFLMSQKGPNTSGTAYIDKSSDTKATETIDDTNNTNSANPTSHNSNTNHANSCTTNLRLANATLQKRTIITILKHTSVLTQLLYTYIACSVGSPGAP